MKVIKTKSNSRINSMLPCKIHTKRVIAITSDFVECKLQKNSQSENKNVTNVEGKYLYSKIIKVCARNF